MMRAVVLSATFAVAVLVFPPGAFAVQATLADQAVTHTEAGGAYVSLGTAGVPADFTASNYDQGTLHHRVEVTDLPAGGNTTTYMVCFVQGGMMACSDNAISIDAAATYETTQAMATLDGYGDIDWSMPLDDIQVVAMDAAGVPVDATETTWAGNPNYGLYYPLELTYQAVVVADGDAFEGFPGDDPGDAAEAPDISPNGGQFEGMVSVTLSTGTADGTIYYTTDGADPDDTSTLYEGDPIVISSDTTLKAITFADGLDPSPISEATFQIVDQLTNGLQGRYYNGREFDELVMTRTDPVLDFEWDGTTPSPDINNPFSIIWTGQVTPRYSDNYTFKTVNDDGVRLWVNDELLIDDWRDHAPQEQTGDISLTADQPVPVWLEYYNGGGPGTLSFSWVSDQQPEELIPATQMVPDLPGGTTASISLLGGDVDELRETDTEGVNLQLRRRGELDASLTVNLEFSGTATNGEDYEQIDSTIAMGPGELSKTISVVPIDDDEVEEYEETIIITVTDGDGYSVSNPSSVTITLLDDDANVFAIAGTVTYTGTESGSIVVEAFREIDETFNKRTTKLINPGPYQLENLEEGDYTVVAFIDANENERLDNGETWNVYSEDGVQTLVTIPPPATGIDINLDVAPGDDGPESDGDGDGGCCATLGGGGSDSSTGWLAALLAAMILGLRRRR